VIQIASVPIGTNGNVCNRPKVFALTNRGNIFVRDFEKDAEWIKIPLPEFIDQEDGWKLGHITDRTA
jgi:hypothetical protein